MTKPAMFVGSSSEAEGLISGLSLNLEGKVAVANWATMAGPLSRSTLDGIERALDSADFAAFILAADDVAIVRGERACVARDNVLFELGLSFGLIGRDRTFILAPSGPGSDMRNPTDLLGITVIPYEPGRDARKTMANPAARLWEAIGALGARDRAHANGDRSRGDTANLRVIADAALHVFESRYKYAQELREAALRGQRIPAKFQFAQADGGRHWLRLCSSPNYLYFGRAKRQLNNNRVRLATKIRSAAGTAAVDLISLGSGDGSKDDIILRSLVAQLSAHEYVYYYPIDISDSLLVEAIRHVARHGLDRARFRCKPVLGDFTDLSSLNGITTYRPNANLFSVLGNALGSFDESEILTSIAGAMQPGDFVLIEANIGEPDDSIALLEDDAANQWDLSTLDALEIPRASCTLEQSTKNDASNVPGTRTLVSYAVPHGPAGSRYILSGMHHYDFDALKETVQAELNVVLMDDIASEGVALLLGQRPL